VIVQVDVDTREHTELHDITALVQVAIARSGVKQAVCHLFVPHTTAGLTLNENWDPDVRGDLLRALAVMVPEVPFHHGEGNSPAHLLSTLVGASETLFVEDGRLLLGSWQGVYLAEFDGPRRRRVLVKIVADPTEAV
jgi:secondary thiamine-phosphate synthase enzyme